jgi:putative ABC transport system ATP-binding protein
MVEVRVENLIKIYKQRNIEVIAIRDVTLSIGSGEFVALVGPSGSGKTTFLHLIGGIDRPTGGKVIVDGENIAMYSDARLTEYRRSKVGFIFQFFNLLPMLTALENVMLPMQLRGMPREERRRRAEGLLKMLGMEHRANHYPDELSGGEQQRVAIAAALANDPPLILADEPTGELDTETGMKIIELLRGLKDKGKTVIVATHDLRITEVADRVLRIEDGKIHEEG